MMVYRLLYWYILMAHTYHINGICFSKPLKESHESQRHQAALHELLSKSLAFPVAQWQGLIQVGAQLLHGLMICYINDSNINMIPI